MKHNDFVLVKCLYLNDGLHLPDLNRLNTYLSEGFIIEKMKFDSVSRTAYFNLVKGN